MKTYLSVNFIILLRGKSKSSFKVLKNFAKSTEKHACQRLFFNNVAGLRGATLLKLAQMFSFKFYEIFKNTFFTEHLRMPASALTTHVMIDHPIKF